MAKFSKGEFVTVPNKTALRGLPPNLQVVFFWLCDHSDDNMQSFPSRATLAKECGIGVKTLDRSIQKLVELGYVVKSTRTNKEQHLTNLYEVVILDPGVNLTLGGSVKNDPRVASDLPQGSVKNDIENSNQLTQTNELNSTNVLVKSAAPTPRTAGRTYRSLFTEIVKALGFTETVKPTPGRIDKLKRRNKTFSYDELISAARNLGADDFMQGDNDKGRRYGDIDYFLRNDENVDKYLNKAELKLTEGAF